MPANPRDSLSYGIGHRRPWVIGDLTAAWKQFESVKAADPDDLEQHFIAGLAIQMAGQDGSEEEYIKFCKKAEAFHISIDEAITYYESIAQKMVEGAREEADENYNKGVGDGVVVEHPELTNIRSRITILKRYGERQKRGRRNSCAVS